MFTEIAQFIAPPVLAVTIIVSCYKAVSAEFKKEKILWVVLSESALAAIGYLIFSQSPISDYKKFALVGLVLFFLISGVLFAYAALSKNIIKKKPWED